MFPSRLTPTDTTYPREGTETYFCFALLSLLSNLTQLIPARGRKRFDLLFFRHLYPTQLIPARGRKRLRRIGRSSRVPDTTYPREGTETPTPPQSRQSGRTQLIPARGRKRSAGFPTGIVCPLTQLIPARGRKRCGASGGQAVCRDTTYPREGTETWAGARGTTTTARHNLSPRGDGNSIPRTIILNVSRHNLSPRGDGNNHFYSPSRFEKDTTYPREGTETGLFRPEI